MSEQIEQPVENGDEHLHVARELTSLVYAIYSQTIDQLPRLKSGLASVESRIPEVVIERLASVKDPVIDGVDHRINQVSHVVSDRVVPAVRAFAIRLPDPMKNAIFLILDTPELLREVKSKADMHIDKGAVDNMKSLVAALKEVAGNVMKGEEEEPPSPEKHKEL